MNSIEKIKVACILDKFSYECFKYECDLLYLSKLTWQEQIEKFQPAFLFVESFWEGLDGSWNDEIISLANKNKSEFNDLIAYCNNNNIPTVFWNKEDPPSFNLFIDAAQKFDYIFTTDINCIPFYKKNVLHGQVYSLSFAAQPKIHNPIEKQRTGEIAFAGSWYQNKHFLRQVEMKFLLDGAKLFDLDIFDRNYGKESFQFPSEYSSVVRGRLEYEDVIKVYKNYKIFLNTNTVFNSATMFSRRVYEILACGTNVVSSYCLGIEENFRNIVPMVTDTLETKTWIENLLNNKRLSTELSVLGIREVYNNHLYTHRFNEILEKIGYTKSKCNSRILVFSYLSCQEQLECLLSNYNRQTYKEKELLIFVDTSKHLDIDSDFNVNVINNIGELADIRSNYDFLAIMSPTNYYGEEYLVDMYHASIYSEADILGKSSYYKLGQGVLSIVNLENENKFIPQDCLQRDTLFINLRNVKYMNLIKTYLGISDKEVVQNIISFSVNRYSFIEIIDQRDKLSINKDMLYEVNISTIELPKICITPEKYKEKLEKDLFTIGYPGFLELFGKCLEDKSKPIVIYGAGIHTSKVLPLLMKGGYNIIGIADRNQQFHGNYLLGKEIQSIEHWKIVTGLTIYISSYEFEDEIYEQLSKLCFLKANGAKIINLYKINKNYAQDILKELYETESNPIK